MFSAVIQSLISFISVYNWHIL